MEIDLTKIQQKYKGLWIALEDDWETVISSDKNIKTAHDEAVAKGFKMPIMFKVPENNIAYFGNLING